MNLNRAKLSQYKIKKIIEFFSEDVLASKTASLLGMNRKTINHWYHIFRLAIYAWQMREFEQLFGEVE